MTDTFTATTEIGLFAEVVVCDDKDIGDVYAQNITCNSVQQSIEFHFYAYTISTNFDPDIYAEGQNLQLYRTQAYSKLGTEKKTTLWETSLASNTANKFRNNFFWSRDTELIETVDWAAPTKSDTDDKNGVFAVVSVF